jgi:CSLREA domain-containing protein
MRAKIKSFELTSQAAETKAGERREPIMARRVNLTRGMIIVAEMLLSAAMVYGQTYTVTKTADTNGTCVSGNCSLREAIAAANSTTANDNINFN